MDELLSQFNVNERRIILMFFDKLAQKTRKSKRMLESAKVTILKSYLVFEPEAIIEGMKVYLSMEVPKSEKGKGINERYTFGIINNKHNEIMKRRERGKAYGAVGAHAGGSNDNRGTNAENCARQNRAVSVGELDCSF